MIRGYFDLLTFERPLPRIEIRVTLPRLSPFPGAVDFLIDTGATSSTIYPKDMLEQFRVMPSRLTKLDEWERHRSSLGIGGRAVQYVERARIELEREDATFRVLDRDIEIAQWSATNESLPSLLGWDVLRHFRIALDARTSVVLLEE